MRSSDVSVEHLVYGIQYYHTRGREGNIGRHVEAFCKCDAPRKTFAIVAAMDDTDCTTRKAAAGALRRRTEEAVRLRTGSDADVVVLHDFNWGGTVAGLELLWRHCQSECPAAHLAFYEEDFHPLSRDWLPASLDLLEQGCIYVGEHAYNPKHHSESFDGQRPRFVKHLPVDRRRRGSTGAFKDIHASYGLVTGGASTYTDGGFYFSTVVGFARVYDAIGSFHKGDRTTKWDHLIDGVVLGEVGFPSEVARCFQFRGLPRSDFFVHR